jgi:hypothetical protein
LIVLKVCKRGGGKKNYSIESERETTKSKRKYIENESESPSSWRGTHIQYNYSIVGGDQNQKFDCN